MSLEKYKQKRDFRKTPEPGPAGKREEPSFAFVVHRHEARRLHYDLRLELDGVLKSWAVPRGPSMKAGDKKLAIMVEDHPLSYLEFQGEIPKGNYGAGTMEIWDRGTYRSTLKGTDPERDMLRQLENGNVKLILNGTHLKGEFALVRLKDSEKNEWLLIKKEDRYSKTSFDIEKIKPVEPLTGPAFLPGKGSMGEKSLENRRKAGRNDSFPENPPGPMPAKLATSIIDDPSWLYEIKYDGYRIISTINRGQVRLYSRNGNDFTKKYTPLAGELKEVGGQVILDGEVVIENEKGLSDFQLLQNYETTGQGKLKYYVFDILYLNGTDLTGFSLVNRKELLAAFFERYNDLENIIHAPYQTGGGKKLFMELAGKGYEGMIAKSPESTYLSGRRTGLWLKVKSHMMQEAVICGYTLTEKKRSFGSLILGIYDNGTLVYAGNCGTGFTDASLKELFSLFQEYVTDKPPFTSTPRFSYPKGKPVWMLPALVCNVKFSGWTNEGIMRHPVFGGLREDKEPGEVVREDKIEGVETDGTVNMANREKTAELEKQDSMAINNTAGRKVKEKTFTISGKKVKCTNLDKLYWPDEGYTKGDLISYYRSIARYILPHLKDRPQSLNRHPDGIGGKSFYHKNMDENQLPSWVDTLKVESGSKGHINYLLCNDTATLVYMANLGCIELNPWHSTRHSPGHPTYMMLDLDPGEISFTEVVRTALTVRDICNELDIPCYCKTSGATGMHIYIPLDAKYNYGQVKAFAEMLAVITHNNLPDITSIERSTAKRRDKIYVDFLQNRKGQTIAAPYSVRPRPHATVSAPLNWAEVNYDLNPGMFTIRNMPSRLEEIGDIWKPVLGKGILINDVLKAIEKRV